MLVGTWHILFVYCSASSHISNIGEKLMGGCKHYINYAHSTALLLQLIENQEVHCFNLHLFGKDLSSNLTQRKSPKIR